MSSRRRDNEDGIDLEPAGEGGGGTSAAPDRRPRMPEPLPVRLIAVNDVRLPASAGLETDLDAFYVGLLGFEREGAPPKPRRLVEPALGGIHGRRQAATPPLVLGIEKESDHRSLPGARPSAEGADAVSEGIVYRAENFRLHFDTVEGLVVRECLRPLGVEVPSLADAQAKLIDAGVEFSHERGTTPGQERLVLLDPAGNWVEVVETKPVF